MSLWGVFQNVVCGVVDPLFDEFVMMRLVVLSLCFGIWAGSRCGARRVAACRGVSRCVAAFPWLLARCAQDARVRRQDARARSQDARKMLMPLWRRFVSCLI